MTDYLRALVEIARSKQMTPQERREQMINFVVGNVGLENSLVTRAVVEDAMERLQAKKVLSRRELLERAERAAQTMLGVSYKKALTMMRKGQLRGTIAEAELCGLQMLLAAAR